MRGFDVFDPKLPLFRNHFLEASAGTGKTFAIENLVMRFLKEGIELKRILVVTFTRRATVELKERISRHLNQEQLSQLDEAKICTIHSFCFHSLQEHALQTGFFLDQFEESTGDEQLKQIIKDFLRTCTCLTNLQLKKVLKQAPEALINQLASLVSHRLPIENLDWDYQKEIEKLDRVDPQLLLEDLIALAPQFRKLCDRQKRVKPEIIEGLKRFTQLLSGEKIDPVDLPIVHFIPENKLKRIIAVDLHYPGFLETLQSGLIPKLECFSNERAIFAFLAEKAREHLERVIENQELIFFEDLIRMMAKNMSHPPFIRAIREAYDAVLIDEFQDTDPLQWKIFSTLFLNEAFKGPLYLVGDPKQSIYRFRGADLYTYFQAKKEMGVESQAALQTNYRSTPPLVEALNRLFAQPFISLPKTGEVFDCQPVKAASTATPIEDGKGCIHYLIAENEKVLFSTIVHEIARLKIPLNQCAILVSDRFQAQRFIEACPLPTVSKKSRSLLDSPAFETLLELLHVAENPRDRSALICVLAGPLFKRGIEQIEEAPEDYARFYRYHHVLKTKGLLSFFQTVIEDSVLSDQELYHDLIQLVEMGVTKKEGYLEFYRGLMCLDPESKLLRTRAIGRKEAIEVMTIHVSKGLEFDVVFPIGLTTPSLKSKPFVRSVDHFVLSDELSSAEEESEKMRLLYVACTRAKKRLYLPILDRESPLSTFLGTHDVKRESHEKCMLYPSPSFEQKIPSKPKKNPFNQTYPPITVHSYSSLASSHFESVTAPQGVIPLGAHTGILIHDLLEKLPFESAFNISTLLTFVSKELKNTFLQPWVEAISTMIYETLHFPLPASDGPFTLQDIHPQNLIKEMEFLFPSKEYQGFLKGFIDLFFEYKGKYYIIDWKTNYVEGSVEKVIKAHEYDLQARIYKEAAERYLDLFGNKQNFKGVFYIFLRNQEVYFFA